MKSALLIILIMLVFFSGLSSIAATKLDFTTVDMLTYRYYQEQKWDSVIIVGKQALRQDIDYYYLRVRMGIAYFEKAEYFHAVTHLKKAREFNSADSFVADFLCRAYRYTNRTEEAGIMKPAIPGEEKDTARSKHGLLQQVHFESGYTLSSDRSPKDLAILMRSDSIYGEKDLYGNSFYSNLGLTLKVSDRVGLTLAYNYLNFSKTRYVQYGHAEALLDYISYRPLSRDYFYSFPWKIHDTAFGYHVSQHEAYIGATVVLPWGLRIMPAFHWINVSYKMNPVYHTDSVSDTAYYLYSDSTYHIFRYASIQYKFTEKDTSFNNYVAAMRISKDLGIFNIAVSGSWSNLNGKTQKQAGIGLTYYPFGNLNCYGITTATGFFQDKDTRLLLSQVLGAKIMSRMWGEANFYYGNYTNANIFNGSVVYNNADIIDYRGGVTLVFEAGTHIRLSLNYQFFRKENQQLFYIKEENNITHTIKEIPQTQNNPYNTNTLIGGITWKL